MHAKLSQVVKLYDQLLTEQISRPAKVWGMATPVVASQPQLQQPTVNRYNSYDAASMSPPVQSPPTAAPVVQQNTGAYVPTPAQYNSPLPNGVSYAQPYSAEPPTPGPAAQYVQAPPLVQQQTYTQPVSVLPMQAQASYQQPPQQVMSPSPEKAYAQTPQAASYSPVTQVQNASVVPPPPTQNVSRSNTLNSVQYVPQTPAVSTYAFSSPNTAPTTVAASTSAPTAAPASFAQPTPVAPVATFAPTPALPAPQPQVQLQPQMPHFPVVPSSNPQNFPLYGPSIPVVGVEQNERQEVLLIDL